MTRSASPRAPIRRPPQPAFKRRLTQPRRRRTRYAQLGRTGNHSYYSKPATNIFKS